ncbi:hypothetical protein B0H14DRAFT_3679339 [Mycena olivaceomarginata]|nr:hypothetical protein B0H14DRAFT_3679339 [Mycena olivaceomarginata]
MRPVIAVATVAKLFSFLSAALASTGFFCYFGVASNSVVLILPGFIVLWIPRDHVTQYHLGVAAHVLRGRVLALHRVRAGDPRGGVREDHVVDDYREYTLCVQREPRCERAVVAVDEELVLGILEKVTAEFCVGSTLKHPNIIATPEHKPKRGATMPAGSVLDPPRAVRARAASTSSPHLDDPASTCNSSETTSILSYTDRDSGSTSITDPPSRITTHSGGSAGALADELGSPRCLQIQNAQPVFKNTVTLPVMGLLTTDSPTEAEMDRNSTELLPLSPREPYTDLTFPSTPSSHTDDLPTPRVGTMPLAVPMSPPRTRATTAAAAASEQPAPEPHPAPPVEPPEPSKATPKKRQRKDNVTTFHGGGAESIFHSGRSNWTLMLGHRSEIASCQETAYESLSVKAAVTLLFFTSQSELLVFAQESKALLTHVDTVARITAYLPLTGCSERVPHSSIERRCKKPLKTPGSVRWEPAAFPGARIAPPAESHLHVDGLTFAAVADLSELAREF